MSARLEFHVKVMARVCEEDDVFVAEAPALDVVSQGDSHEEALENLVRAIQRFLTTCYEMGTLDEALQEAGFQPAKSARPTKRQEGAEIVDVPLPLLARGRHVENLTR